MQKKICSLLILSVATALGAAAQTAGPASLATLKYQYKVGVLPFVDTTGNLEDKGTVIARLLQSELTHNSDLEVRFIKPADDAGSDIDSDTAVKLARDHKNDVVVLATILSAQVDESDHSAQGPSIFGQTLAGSTHSAKATVELQADLYSSVTGKKIDSIRVTGEEKSANYRGPRTQRWAPWVVTGKLPTRLWARQCKKQFTMPQFALPQTNRRCFVTNHLTMPTHLRHRKRGWNENTHLKTFFRNVHPSES